MLIHGAMHWPDALGDARDLWPFCTTYAAYIWNTFLILSLVFHLLIFGLVLVGLFIVFINFMSGDAWYMSWISPFRMERRFLSENLVPNV